ncbi:class I SAM-dependent methyltransferase [Massilia aerilata]|uniref:Class I SAM-dependent methyltransferase n=1 Tax=Massilia aerilata TaxID=453817 RepID=A0ABW0RVP2_9BURK
MKTHKPSNTALVVAGGLQLAGAQFALPTHALPREALRCGEPLLRRAHPRLASLLCKAWFRRLCLVLERATLPGICLHFALRKQILRRHAQAALAAGCTQVIVLGAGFDTLCMELKAARPDLCCIEIDHPATQAVRRAAAGDGGVGFIAADLAQQALGPLLAAHPDFRAEAPTLFVAEGLLMYMPLDAVRALFAQMAAAAPRSQVAFTWFEPLADGRPGFRRRSRLIDWWLRRRGEPFLSGMARAGLPDFLAGAGFVLRQVNASGDLLDASQVKTRPIEGEYIALASARQA